MELVGVMDDMQRLNDAIFDVADSAVEHADNLFQAGPHSRALRRRAHDLDVGAVRIFDQELAGDRRRTVFDLLRPEDAESEDTG